MIIQCSLRAESKRVCERWRDQEMPTTARSLYSEETQVLGVVAGLRYPLGRLPREGRSQRACDIIDNSRVLRRPGIRGESTAAPLKLGRGDLHVNLAPGIRGESTAAPLKRFRIVPWEKCYCVSAVNPPRPH